MIKQILVPTDFSETSAGALRYAWHLSQKLGAALRVIHVYHPSFDLNNPYLDIPVQDFGDIKQQNLENFITESGILQESGRETQALETALILGFAGEEIVSQATKTDLIVMGKTGVGRRPLEAVFGSVSTFTAQNATCPVLLIPHKTEYREIKTVMYSSNFPSADEALLARALPFFKLSPEVIHLVHVEEKPDSSYQVAEVPFEQFVHRTEQQLPIHSVNITCKNVLQGLSQYALEKEVNLIIMGTVHRNFLERLFHRSVTQKMIFNLKHPLLILHFDD